MYKQIIGINGKLRTDAILKIADNAVIPFDPANTDYQQYLAWLAEGNQPEPEETL
jgi:hypothetical protein